MIVTFAIIITIKKKKRKVKEVRNEQHNNREREFTVARNGLLLLLLFSSLSREIKNVVNVSTRGGKQLSRGTCCTLRSRSPIVSFALFPPGTRSTPHPTPFPQPFHPQIYKREVSGYSRHSRNSRPRTSSRQSFHLLYFAQSPRFVSAAVAQHFSTFERMRLGHDTIEKF